MKKRNLFHSVTALLLCLSLCLCTAGCGKNKDDSAAEKKGGDDPQQTAEPTPEYVYNAKFVEVKGEFDSWLSDAQYSNGRLLASGYGKIGEEIPEGVTPEWEGQYDIYGSILYWIDLDGNVEKIENYQPITDEEGNTSGMNCLLAMPDGTILAVETIWKSWYDGPDDVERYSDEWYEKGYYEYEHYSQTYFLRTLNPDGSEIRCIPMNDSIAADENFYINNVVLSGSDRLIMTSDQQMYVLDLEGNLISAVATEQYFDNVFALKDGRVAAVYWGEEGERLAFVDMETGTLSEGIPYSGGYSRVQNMGGEYDTYYSNGSNLLGFSVETGETEKILNWINCDLNNNDLNSIIILEDGRILATMGEWDEDYDHCTNTLAILEKVPYSAVPQKTRLTFATQYLNYNVTRAIVDFNRKSSDVRIEVKDYSEYNTEEDYSAGLTKLNTEILSGNVPDILDMNGLNVEELASKGLLMDLYPLIDADSELSREDLFPSVVKALEYNGGLYRTASSFAIQTLIGAASVVGDTPGWTLAEFRAALATMPEGCTPLSESVTRTDMLYTMLYLEMNELVDMATGTCYFNSQTFRDILEFSGEFPETYEWDEDRVWTEEDDEWSRASAGKQMLIEAYLSDFTDFSIYDAIFGGDATCIGFPVTEGVGSALELNDTGVAISAKCADVDAAWSFVRSFLTEEYQTENTWGFPTNMAAFNAKLEKAMTPEYEKDENGNYVLDANGEKIEMAQGGIGVAGGPMVELYALTQAQADEVISVLEGTTRVRNYGNEEIVEIIIEDTQAYYAGQKTMDDTVNQLQSKLNIFVNEKR